MAVLTISPLMAQEKRLQGPHFPKGDFPGDSDSEESSCNAGDLGSTPGWERSPGAEHDNLLLYSCLENPYGQISLEGYSSWGRKESDMTERLSTAHSTSQNQQNRDSRSYSIPAAERRRFRLALNSLFFFSSPK